MTRTDSVRALIILALGLAAMLVAVPLEAQNPEASAAVSPTPMSYEELSSETPAEFEEVARFLESRGYTRAAELVRAGAIPWRR